ncbi:MAG: class I SAM-dependent RNA methyltransferase, partial [Flavobacteriales bacterium]
MWQIKPGDTNLTILCKTFEGLEEVLENELLEMGKQPERLKRAVQLTGNFSDVLMLNFKLRTALNVMVKVAEFKARNPDELFKKAFDVDWHKFFDVNHTFAVSHTVRSEHFAHSQFAALKVKDAIVDRFKKEVFKRPSVDREEADVVVHVRISHDNVSLWFDTSGKALYIRGYKKVNGPAPLNEVLAAGLIKLTGWDLKQPVYNPMCGGGTLGFEAFMMANQIAPSFNRSRFAYHALPWFNADEEIRIQREVKLIVSPPESFNVRFSDNDPRAVDAAKRNASSFYGLGEPRMEFVQEDFFETKSTGNKSLILINPPYGERMEEADLIGFYKQIGNTLK